MVRHCSNKISISKIHLCTAEVAQTLNLALFIELFYITSMIFTIMLIFVKSSSLALVMWGWGSGANDI